ncbi:hypothetical protein Ancab_038532 [Ancistrocladus abbreviatus]
MIVDLGFEVPLVATTNDLNGVSGHDIDVVEKKSNGRERDIVLGRDMHASCLDITEPEANDEQTSDKEAYMASVFVRREVFSDRILYASEESHYFVFKAAWMYKMDCVKVETLASGEIDCADFGVKLQPNKDKLAIINVNIGTTMKGAVDNLDLVIQTLEESGFPRDRFYIHCDGALFGLTMPFARRNLQCGESIEIEGQAYTVSAVTHRYQLRKGKFSFDTSTILRKQEKESWKENENDMGIEVHGKAPKVSFKKPFGGVSVSGDKFVGCPVPCSVQITRIENINVLSRNVEYLASRDATIMGSRNDHASILLWYTLNRKGYQGFEKDVQKCLCNAHYLHDRLRDAGLSAMLNDLSSTVVFEWPQDEEFVRRWQLAC